MVNCSSAVFSYICRLINSENPHPTMMPCYFFSLSITNNREIQTKKQTNKQRSWQRIYNKNIQNKFFQSLLYLAMFFSCVNILNNSNNTSPFRHSDLSMTRSRQMVNTPTQTRWRIFWGTDFRMTTVYCAPRGQH